MSDTDDTVNEIILAAGGSPAGSDLPAVRPADALETAITAAIAAAEGVRLGYKPDPAALRTAMAAVVALPLRDIARRLDDARRPATVKEISVLLARLAAGYPTNNRAPAFGKLLVEQVSTEAPRIGALAFAVRDLHLDLRFIYAMPTIAAIVDAYRAADQRLAGYHRELAGFPQLFARARTWLKRFDEDQARKAAAAAERAAAGEARKQRWPDGAWYLRYLESWLAQATTADEVKERYRTEREIRNNLGTPMTSDELEAVTDMKLAAEARLPAAPSAGR
jgi:hypothetical protein